MGAKGWKQLRIKKIDLFLLDTIQIEKRLISWDLIFNFFFMSFQSVFSFFFFSFQTPQDMAPSWKNFCYLKWILKSERFCNFFVLSECRKSYQNHSFEEKRFTRNISSILKEKLPFGEIPHGLNRKVASNFVQGGFWRKERTIYLDSISKEALLFVGSNIVRRKCFSKIFESFIFKFQFILIIFFCDLIFNPAFSILFLFRWFSSFSFIIRFPFSVLIFRPFSLRLLLSKNSELKITASIFNALHTAVSSSTLQIQW